MALLFKKGKKKILLEKEAIGSQIFGEEKKRKETSQTLMLFYREIKNPSGSLHWNLKYNPFRGSLLREHVKMKHMNSDLFYYYLQRRMLPPENMSANVFWPSSPQRC